MGNHSDEIEMITGLYIYAKITSMVEVCGKTLEDIRVLHRITLRKFKSTLAMRTVVYETRLKP